MFFQNKCLPQSPLWNSSMVFCPSSSRKYLHSIPPGSLHHKNWFMIKTLTTINLRNQYLVLVKPRGACKCCKTYKMFAYHGETTKFSNTCWINLESSSSDRVAKKLISSACGFDYVIICSSIFPLINFVGLIYTSYSSIK